MKHELINFMFYLVSQAAVFRMSRNPPPKEGALRDIQKTAERETMFYLSPVQPVFCHMPFMARFRIFRRWWQFWKQIAQKTQQLLYFP